MSSIEVSTVLKVTQAEAWDSLYDIEARSAHIESFRGLEVLSRSDDEMIVRMDEHVDGADVTVTSRFRFERPNYLAYEHIEGPFGKNEGRFELSPHAEGCVVLHRHESEQDLDVKTSLRDEWIKMMHNMHATIELVARQKRGQG